MSQAPGRELRRAAWLLIGWVCLGCIPRQTVVSTPSAPLPAPPVVTTPGPSAVAGSPPVLAVPRDRNLWKPKGKERNWKYIVLHHTASSAGSVETIDETHRQRKDASGKPWLGIGYHFVIGNGQGMPDGAIEPTFRWVQQMHGAHAGQAQYNQEGIGIVLVGNFEKTPPTPAQLASVKRLVRSLKGTYRISSRNVIPHRDVKATECPGRLFPLNDVAGLDLDLQFGQADSPAGFDGPH